MKHIGLVAMVGCLFIVGCTPKQKQQIDVGVELAKPLVTSLSEDLCKQAGQRLNATERQDMRNSLTACGNGLNAAEPVPAGN